MKFNSNQDNFCNCSFIIYTMYCIGIEQLFQGKKIKNPRSFPYDLIPSILIISEVYINPWA